MCNFQANIYESSPALSNLRGLLSKQRLAWEEEPGVLPALVMDYSSGLGEYVEEEPVASVIVKVTGNIVKSKKPRVPRKPKALDTHSSISLSDGSNLWTTPSGSFKASFAYDRKQYAKAIAEANKRTERRLTGDFTDGFGRSLGHSDFTPHLKGEL